MTDNPDPARLCERLLDEARAESKWPGNHGALLREAADMLTALSRGRVEAMEEEKLMPVLVLAYRIDPAETARLCDEQVDRSGAFLGRLRLAAIRALAQDTPGG